MPTDAEWRFPVRDELLALIHRRAERLMKLTALNRRPPDRVVALIAGHLLRTVIVLCGTDLTTEWSMQIYDAWSEDQGVCRFCHEGKFVSARGMCEKCWQEAAEEDEAPDD